MRFLTEKNHLVIWRAKEYSGRGWVGLWWRSQSNGKIPAILQDRKVRMYVQVKSDPVSTYNAQFWLVQCSNSYTVQNLRCKVPQQCEETTKNITQESRTDKDHMFVCLLLCLFVCLKCRLRWNCNGGTSTTE